MRKLKLEGSSYQSLLDAKRKEQAIWHLQHSKDSIEIIAERLGYQDSSNFSRTFRREYGCTPSEVRATALAGTGDIPPIRADVRPPMDSLTEVLRILR